MFRQWALFIVLIFFGQVCYGHIKWSPYQILESQGRKTKVAINNNGQAVVVWEGWDVSGGVFRVRADYSIDGGQSWSGTPQWLSASGVYAFNPMIAINNSGDTVVNWNYEYSPPSINCKIQVRSSGDGGQTWGSTSNLTPSSNDARYNNIAINEARQAIAIWFYNNLGVYEVQTASSSDGGATWSSAITLSSAANYDNTGIAINDTGVAIAIWDDLIAGKSVIQTKYSTDGGLSWSTTAQSLSASLDNSYQSQVAINNNGWAVAIWWNNTQGNIQTKFSSDGGQSWASPVGGINLSGALAYSYPVIAINNNEESVAIWSYQNGAIHVIQAAYSTDGGINWSSPVATLSSSSDDSINPWLAMNDKGEVVVIWNNTTTNTIQTTCSIDGGQSWSGNIVNLGSITGTVYPDIDLNENGQVIGGWYGASSAAAYGMFGFDVFSDQFDVDLLLQKDYVNRLYWETIPEASFYRVYTDYVPENLYEYNTSISGTTILHKVYEGTMPKAYIHGSKNKDHNRYYITWVNSLGNESQPETIIVP